MVSQEQSMDYLDLNVNIPSPRQVDRDSEDSEDLSEQIGKYNNMPIYSYT